MFYPPKGDTKYLTRGPIIFTYVLIFFLEKYFEEKKITAVV